MKSVPDNIMAEGTEIIVEAGGLSMPMSDKMLRENGCHPPETNGRAWAMARRLKGKALKFPNNISFGGQRSKIKTLTGSRDGPEKRQDRIDRRERKERNVLIISISIVVDDHFKKSEIFANVLAIEGVLNVKSLNEGTLVIETERRMENKDFGQKEINEIIIKKLEDDCDGIKEVTGIDFQDKLRR